MKIDISLKPTDIATYQHVTLDLSNGFTIHAEFDCPYPKDCHWPECAGWNSHPCHERRLEAKYQVVKEIIVEPKL